METIRAQFEPTSVAEWDNEDEVSGVLADDNPTKIGEEAARAMLSELLVNLPKVLDWTELGAYVRANNKTLGDFHIPPDTTNFDYYAVEVPLSLIVPPSQRLVRLRLSLDLTSRKGSETVIAYDLFPSTHVDVRTLMSGEASVDVAEGLQYALVAAGVPAPLAGITKCLGLKLSLPFKWTSKFATVQSSARMANPVVWSVTDDAIQDGFSASVIVRAPKGSGVNVAATLYGELRRKVLGVFEKTQFKTFEPQSYTVG